MCELGELGDVRDIYSILFVTNLMAILGQGAPQAGPQTNQAGKADCSDFTREILKFVSTAVFRSLFFQDVFHNGSFSRI